MPATVNGMGADEAPVTAQCRANRVLFVADYIAFGGMALAAMVMSGPDAATGGELVAALVTAAALLVPSIVKGPRGRIWFGGSIVDVEELKADNRKAGGR